MKIPQFAFAAGLLVLVLATASLALRQVSKNGPGLVPDFEPDSPELDMGLLEEAEEEEEEQEKAIVLELLYTGEVFHNTRGGLRTYRAANYHALVDVALTADLDLLGCLPGGRIFILGQDSHGTNFTENFPGDSQFVSNIDADPFYQISEYWWEKYLCDEKLGFRLGKQDANNDFASVTFAQPFINSSFGLHPTIPMPTFPDPSMGAVMFLSLGERWSMHVGVFDGEPFGENWGFSGTGVTFTMLEIEREGEIGGRLNDIHAAVWYHSGEWESLSAFSSDAYRGLYGVHFELEQMLIQLTPTDELEDGEIPNGLAFFLQYSWSPKNRNPTHEYLGMGLVIKGPFAKRMDDGIGLGFARLRINDPGYAHVAPETAIELFYKAWLTEKMMIQPDIQYIANPSGIYRDSLVAGVRFEVGY